MTKMEFFTQKQEEAPPFYALFHFLWGSLRRSDFDDGIDGINASLGLHRDTLEQTSHLLGSVVEGL